MSWKPEVQTGNDPVWYGNGLRFATQQEAFDNAFNLSMRWTAVHDYRASESDDPVNYAWVDGKLLGLGQGALVQV
jgi:hypothetical protein